MSNILKLSISFLFAILFGYIIASLVNDTYSIENTDFEDINFYKCVVDAYNEENNTDIDYLSYNLTDEQLGSISSVSCISSALKITSIKGVEKLSSLTSLKLNNTLLTSVDVSKNSSLTYLDVSRNKITSIVTNGKLEYLDVSSNFLTFLSVDSSFKKIIADDNEITSVDLSNAVLLEELNLSQNKLTTIDVTNNTSLKRLELKNNYLSQIDVTNNTELTYLDISNGSEYCLNGGFVTGENKYSSVDVSKNLMLKTLIVDQVELNEIDISNNLLLEDFSVSKNYDMYEIDVTNNEKLRKLDLSAIGLEKVDISKNVLLEELNLSGNFLKELDLNKNSKLVELYASQNEFVSLDLSNCLLLKVFYAYDNSLKEIDLSNNLLLEEIAIWSNFLQKIDLSKHVNLRHVDLYNHYFDANFRNVYYVYSGEIISLNINDIVKLPEHLGWDEPKFEFDCSGDKVNGICDTSIEEDGTFGSIRDHEIQFSYNGDKYDIYGTINSVYLMTEWSNDDIVIKSKDSVIYTNKLNGDYIFSSLKFPGFGYGGGDLPKDLKPKWLEVDVDNMKVYVKHEEQILKEFDIVYENYELPDRFIGNNERYLYNVEMGTSVESLIDLLEADVGVTVSNKFGEKLSSDDLVSTGDDVLIEFQTFDYKYKLVVPGDVDGDGFIRLSDIMKTANYLYKDKTSLYNSYLFAADYDKNGKYDLSDIMKMANKLYGKKT